MLLIIVNLFFFKYDYKQQSIQEYQARMEQWRSDVQLFKGTKILHAMKY